MFAISQSLSIIHLVIFFFFNFRSPSHLEKSRIFKCYITLEEQRTRTLYMDNTHITPQKTIQRKLRKLKIIITNRLFAISSYDKYSKTCSIIQSGNSRIFIFENDVDFHKNLGRNQILIFQ